MAKQRRPFVCGNWKLNHLREDTEQLTTALAAHVSNLTHVDVAIAPVATHLWIAQQARTNSALKLAAQNVSEFDSGAHTGEFSIAHIREMGCDFAIVGHSERRAHDADTNERVGAKVTACLKGGITPIACVGETLSDRESRKTFDVVGAQLRAILRACMPNSDVVIAYEPVWAIGTGKVATPDQAQEVHAYIRKLMRELIGTDFSPRTRILYGGSVKATNAAELMQQSDIDGFLVGGASLKIDDFLPIMQAAGGI